MRKNILVLLIVLLGIPCLAQEEAPGQFIRFEKGVDSESGELQIAKATYVHPETKVEVVMYGVVHLADKIYYEKVQRDLDSYDAVLFEGVGTPEEKKKIEKTNAPPSPTALIQKFMCDVLGMEYQLEAINYKTPKNFVHADMSAKEFMERMGGKPLTPLPSQDSTLSQFMGTPLGKMVLKFGMKMVRQFFDMNPQWRKAAKMQMAKQLSQAVDKGGKVPGMSDQMYRVIVIERNKIVMKVIDRETKKREKGTLCVFYGAAHMTDFHERMTKLGYTQKNKTWISAWTLGKGAIKSKKPKKVSAEWF